MLSLPGPQKNLMPKTFLFDNAHRVLCTSRCSELTWPTAVGSCLGPHLIVVMTNFVTFFSEEMEKTTTEELTAVPPASSDTEYLPFPSSADLNTRLRRIVTSHQKFIRKKMDAAAASAERVSILIALLEEV